MSRNRQWFEQHRHISKSKDGLFCQKCYTSLMDDEKQNKTKPKKEKSSYEINKEIKNSKSSMKCCGGYLIKNGETCPFCGDKA